MRKYKLLTILSLLFRRVSYAMNRLAPIINVGWQFYNLPKTPKENKLNLNHKLSTFKKELSPSEQMELIQKKNLKRQKIQQL